MFNRFNHIIKLLLIIYVSTVFAHEDNLKDEQDKQQPATICYISELSDEVLIQIFSKLEVHNSYAHDLSSVSLVNCRWQLLSQDHTLWQPIVHHLQCPVNNEHVKTLENDQKTQCYKDLIKNYSQPSLHKVPSYITLLGINDHGDCCGFKQDVKSTGIRYRWTAYKTYKIDWLSRARYIEGINNQSTIFGTAHIVNLIGIYHAALWYKNGNHHVLPLNGHDCSDVIAVDGDIVFGTLGNHEANSKTYVQWQRNKSTNEFDISFPNFVDDKNKEFWLNHDKTSGHIINAVNEDHTLYAGFFKERDDGISESFLIKDNNFYALQQSSKIQKESTVCQLSADGEIIVGRCKLSTDAILATLWIKEGNIYNPRQLNVPINSLISSSTAKFISKDGKIIAGDIRFTDGKHRIGLWLNKQFYRWSNKIFKRYNFNNMISMSRNGSNFIISNQDSQFYIVHVPRGDLMNRYFKKFTKP